MKKITMSVKSQAFVCPRKYSSFWVNDGATSQSLNSLNGLMANHGVAQFAVVDSVVAPDRYELPSGYNVLPECSVTVRATDKNRVSAWLNIPCCAVSDNIEDQVKEIAQGLIEGGIVVSQSGHALDTSEPIKYQITVTTYAVQDQQVQG